MIDPNKLKKGVRGVLKNGSRFIFQDIDYVEVGGDAVKIDLSRYEKINKTIKNLGL